MNFLDELKASLPYSSTITKRQSDEILLDIAAEVELGASFDDILVDLATEDYSKDRKISSILKSLKADLGYLEVEDILLKYRVISQDEYILVKNSSNLGAAIRNIIDLREEGKDFFRWLKNYLLAPIIIIALGFILQIPLTEALMRILNNEIIPAITASKGVAPLVHLPFYMENTLWTYFFAGGFFLLCAGVWAGGVYVYKRDPAFIYKTFTIKFYDDFFYFFKIMDMMKKAQPTLTVDAIFEEMGDSIDNDGIKKFFLSMGEKKDEFWFDFQQINAPFGVVKKIRKYEEHDTLFKELNFIVEGKKKGFLWFLKTKRDARMDSIHKWTSKTLLMLSYSFVLFYILITVTSFVGVIVTML